MNSLHEFKTRDQLVEQLGTDILAKLKSAVVKTGNATMAVSGGSSPVALFEFLSRQAFNWSAVTITLVDERWVNENNPDSNAKLVKETLLQNHASGANFMALYNGDKNPFAAEEAVNQTLSALKLPFDVVVLGMGEDGHTASFFPGAKALQQALYPDKEQLCCAIEPPSAPHQRMTLTLPTLLSTGIIYLLVTGKNKLPVLQQAMKTFKGDGDQRQWIEELPVRTVLHQQQCTVETYYAD